MLRVTHCSCRANSRIRISKFSPPRCTLAVAVEDRGRECAECGQMVNHGSPCGVTEPLPQHQKYSIRRWITQRAWAGDSRATFSHRDSPAIKGRLTQGCAQSIKI